MNRRTLGRSKCKGRKVSANIRDCLAKAIQAELEGIVDQTVFSESPLPDTLISTGCLTEDECRAIRDIPDRKDQIRILVTVIRGRDEGVLENYLNCLGKDNEHLAQKIRELFKQNVQTRVRDKRCVRCKLKAHVNIKYVSDRLFSKALISDNLYNRIVYNTSPPGAQEELWDRLLVEIEANDDAEEAFLLLKSSLSDKGHYRHLSEEIDRSLTNENKLYECSCHVILRPTSIQSVSPTESICPKSSSSPESQISSVELRSKCLDKRNSHRKGILLREDIVETIGQESSVISDPRSIVESIPIPQHRQSSGTKAVDITDGKAMSSAEIKDKCPSNNVDFRPRTPNRQCSNRKGVYISPKKLDKIMARTQLEEDSEA